MCGCGAIATSPTWVGGGLATTGPLRLAQEETVEIQQRKRVSAEPEEIGARHILVMHDDSQSKPEELSRSRDEALALATECLKKLRSGGDFSELVREYSDEPGAAERGGDLGVFKRAVMVKSFSDAAFALKVGEVSEILETAYGFHIVKRTR
jgi:NIMA-interacting peptidyl-prolyl cis-trans isomerase 1